MDRNFLLNAVAIASSGDVSLRQQANSFLVDVRQNAVQHWGVCLSIFLEGAGAPNPTTPGKDGNLRCSPEARMVCLAVVDEILGDKAKFDTIPVESQAAVQSALVDYVQTEYIHGSAEGGSPGAVQSIMRNKVAHTLALLFIVNYPSLRSIPSKEPSILSALLPYLLSPPNPHIVLLVLHLISEISEEVHDGLLKSARPYTQDRSVRDAKIRDEVRDVEAVALNDAVLGVLEGGLKNVQAGQTEWWLEVVTRAVRALNGYIPWLEVTLTVTPRTLSILSSLLSSNHCALKLLCLDTLQKIVVKGMKDPAEKVEMLSALSIIPALTPIEYQTSVALNQTKVDPKEFAANPFIQQRYEKHHMVDLRERMGKLVDSYGVELGKIAAVEALADDKTKAQAEVLILAALPIFLELLGDGYDEVTTSVFGFLDDIFRRHKRAKKGDALVLTDDKRAFFGKLLEVVIKKMQWDEDATWSLGEEDGDADPDEVAQFQTMRKQLKTAVESIAVIDPPQFIAAISGLVTSILSRFESGGQSAITWQEAELAMFLIYSYSEFSINKVNGKGAFVQIPAEVQAQLSLVNKRRASTSSSSSSVDMMAAEAFQKPSVNYTELPLTVQGELLYRAVQSNISSYPHPSVPLQCFECAVRYAEFFKLRQELIQPTLASLLDSRGNHNEVPAVRNRSFYLFHRFTKEMRFILPEELIPSILSSMSDLLPIEAELPDRETDEEDLLLKATTVGGPFDSQLYLFETVGNLIYTLKKSPNQQLVFLQTVTAPLFNGISENLVKTKKSADDNLHILQIHHLVMALGNIAKGFQEPNDSDISAEPPVWISVFKQATEAILAVLERFNEYRVIRNAARFSFARIVATTGNHILEYVALFVKGIVQHFEPSELVEFLSFLGLVLHKLKGNLFDVLDGLVLPIIQKIFQALATPSNGTDEEISQASLKHAYLGFIAGIMGAKLDAVFLSDLNKPELENILNNIISFAVDPKDPVCQRIAFGILNKTIIAWASSPTAMNGATNGSNGANISPQVIPGFENYIYDRVLPLCIEVPSSSEFKIRDGQSQLVLGEISGLYKSLIAARGQEFIRRMTDVYFPSIGCPPDTALEFVNQLQTLETKSFRKWFTEFLKSARDAQTAAQKALQEQAKAQA